MLVRKIALAQIITQAVYGLPSSPSETDVRVLALARRDKIELEALAGPARLILADRTQTKSSPSPEHRFPADLDRTTATTWTERQADLFVQMSELEWGTVREALDEMHARSSRDHSRRLFIADVIGKLDAAACRTTPGADT